MGAGAMSRKPKISPSVLLLVQRWREKGVPWKRIEWDLHCSGQPSRRETYWGALNRERRRAMTREAVKRHRARKQQQEAGGTPA